MKSLLDHIPHHERLIVIEQPAELKVAHPNAVRWEAVERFPARLPSLRVSSWPPRCATAPDRIIMGEIRDECGYDLLQAMNTGHGRNAIDHPCKVRVGRPESAVRFGPECQAESQSCLRPFPRTAEAIDFVLYCERDPTGRRRVRELITVTGYAHADQSFETKEIYRAGEEQTR